ncbi:GspH/FimT family pseudopilin [Gammaproteobacteria bacterium AS21]
MRYLALAQRGVSFIELLSVTAIVAILILYGLPRFSQIINSSHLEQRQSAFLNMLKLAKLEAVRNSNRVISCRLDELNFNCAGNKATGVNNWSSGWITFVDLNNDKLYQVIEQVVDTNRFNANKCSMSWNRGDYLSYFKFGVLAGGVKAGSFNIVCASVKSKVTINWIGRARVSVL